MCLWCILTGILGYTHSTTWLPKASCCLNLHENVLQHYSILVWKCTQFSIRVANRGHWHPQITYPLRNGQQCTAAPSRQSLHLVEHWTDRNKSCQFSPAPLLLSRPRLNSPIHPISVEKPNLSPYPYFDHTHLLIFIPPPSRGWNPPLSTTFLLAPIPLWDIPNPCNHFPVITF